MFLVDGGIVQTGLRKIHSEAMGVTSSRWLVLRKPWSRAVGGQYVDVEISGAWLLSTM